MHIRSCRARPTLVLVALILAALLAGPAAPRPLVAAQGVAPMACEPVTGIAVRGPDVGTVYDHPAAAQYAFRASVSAASMRTPTPPITLHWRVTGLAEFDSVIDAGTSQTQEFSWSTGGIKTVEVTARNCTDSWIRAATAQIAISPLPLADVPLDAVRRAAQLLEAQRSLSPGWAQAMLYSEDPLMPGWATPLYRPGITGPAYYEFQVFRPGANWLKEAGFIIVSTAEHDYPITNWTTEGWAPTAQMRQQAALDGVDVSRFFKLDVLAYAAEDQHGARTVTLGDQPLKIELPPGWADSPPPITSVWAPTDIYLEDPLDGTNAVTSTMHVSGTLQTVNMAAWSSWNELKNGYVTTYAPYIQRLAENAAPEWEAEHVARESGYTLYLGDSITFPLLWPDPTWVPSGLAYEHDLVSIEQQSPPGGLPQLVITAVDDVPGIGVPMTTTVTYGNDIIETLNVFVVGTWPYSCYLPIVTRGGAGGAGAASVPEAAGAVAQADVEAQEAGPGTLGPDGYRYWFVGGTAAAADAQQAWYDQFDATTPDCKSGCGPTAWAMLIAWGDRRAHEGTNTAWAGRTGLYRQNGGRGPMATVAPTAMEPGVENMVDEIRNDVGTFCWDGKGATHPALMFRVLNYLSGRSGMNVRTWHLPAGFSVTGYDEQSLRTFARNVIKNEGDWARPTVIGTGFLSHYPLAYGYREKTEQICWNQCQLVWGTTQCAPTCRSVTYRGFYVNQGWGNSSGEWVAADLFFTGRLTPHAAYVDDVALYRPSDSTWHLDYQHDGTENDWHPDYQEPGWPSTIRPAVGDFDRDGVLDDLVAFIYAHTDSAKRYNWYFDLNTNNAKDRTLDHWTSSADGWPFALDYDRDGFVDDIGVYFPQYLTDGSEICYDADHDGVSTVCSGYYVYGDYRIPVSGDFDNDGYHDDVGFYSRFTGNWYYDMDHDGDMDSTSGPWGLPNDRPVAGDFDEDGVVDDLGMFSTGDFVWHYDYNHDRTSQAGYDAYSGPWGAAGDLPFVGNFDTN